MSTIPGMIAAKDMKMGGRSTDERQSMREKIQFLMVAHRDEPEMLEQIERAHRRHEALLLSRKRQKVARLKSRKVAKRSRRINR